MMIEQQSAGCIKGENPLKETNQLNQLENCNFSCSWQEKERERVQVSRMTARYISGENRLKEANQLNQLENCNFSCFWQEQDKDKL